jgi:hypothetical protein
MFLLCKNHPCSSAISVFISVIRGRKGKTALLGGNNLQYLRAEDIFLQIIFLFTEKNYLCGE